MSKDLEENICAESVFERVYNKHSKSLHDFLYYKYGAQFNPSDKAQDAFMKLWDNCSKVTFSKARSFLFTVANNMMLNEIKHQKVVLKYEKHNPKNHNYESPEFILEKDEYYIRYQKALENLTDEQRVAFLMNKVDGKKHNEIAEYLGVTRKVVEYRIYSAFKALKEDLEDFNIK
ncbi:MAG: RNA polymerase sigma factor [Bacteroidia bacterium]|nr:RNA polymerase sigma factor [Bacteroidia bacterium]NNK59065.1 RNA polymerase sigma factor [Flavobacteriaceae bacterium]NNL32508.1 RNA polymerase sigma factor [Flavobacteriaceae bacterium]